MKKDDFTVVVFPGAMASPKKFYLPRKFAKISFALIGIVLVVFFGSSFFFVQQYLNMLAILPSQPLFSRKVTKLEPLNICFLQLRV